MKNKSKQLDAFIPSKFSPEDHIKHYDPSLYGITEYSKSQTRFRDHLLYLLSLISEVAANDNRQAELDKGGYTYLHSRIMQEVVYEYRPYLEYLKATNVIQQNRYYLPEYWDKDGEGQSYGYRFTPYFQSDELVVVKYSVTFSKRLIRRRARYIQKKLKSYDHLIKWIYPTSNLVIDFELGQQYLTFRRDAQLTNPDLLDYGKDRKTGIPFAKDPHEQYRSNCVNLRKIASGNLLCTIDSTVHRFHNPLTSLKSELRNLLSYWEGGKLVQLVCIDVKNSQPYLSSLLLDPDNIMRIKQVCKLAGYKPAQAAVEKLCKLYTTEYFKHDDVELYKSLVSDMDGNPLGLYEYMFNQCHEAGIPFKDRDAVKEGMFEVLFGSVTLNTPTKKLFARLFPNVFRVFCLLKTGHKRDLSCLLQSIESYFLLKVVAKSIAQKYPKAPLFPIHDSLTTTVEYSAQVYKLIKEELTQLVGLPPKLKVEEWEPDAIDWQKYRP